MSDTAQHTPGPWEIRDAEGSFEIRTHGTPFGTTGIWSHMQVNGSGNDPRYIVTTEEAKANALLIAAAPDLLEALQIAMSHPMTGNWYEAARAAIAKATGKEGEA